MKEKFNDFIQFVEVHLPALMFLGAILVAFIRATAYLIESIRRCFR